MIEVKDVVKSFDGNVVLNHVSTEMRDGEVNMIIASIADISYTMVATWRK